MVKVLVVDDEAMVLESIRLTLTCSGYEVTTAGSGAEALEIIGNGEFQVVVTDRKMPVMTGEQLALAIKAKHPKIPIIMLTGFPPDRKPAAVDAIVLKPFSTEVLRAAIKRVTGG